MSAAFITSSGTEIGKTLVAAALVNQLCHAGKQPRVLKPVMSGFDPLTWQSCDAASLLAAQGATEIEQAIAQISPWRFTAPLSPHLAAEAEGRKIDFDALCAFCSVEIAAARTAGEPVVIEGVGGVMVPLTRRETVLDWMEALAIPAVLVTGSYLGALSHTLTAAATLAAREIEILAIVVNESSDSVGLEATAKTLGDFLPTKRITVIPRIDAAEEPWRYVPPLADITFGG